MSEPSPDDSGKDEPADSPVNRELLEVGKAQGCRGHFFDWTTAAVRRIARAESRRIPL